MVTAPSSPAANLPRVLIRADATPQMGTGHIMRCLALAQAWQEAGGSALAVCASLTSALEARLRVEGVAVSHLEAEAGSPQDATETAALARQAGAGSVILDGYGFSGEYQQAIVRSGLPLLAVDDYGHAGHYWAGLVLNQNLVAGEALYPSREPATHLLLGTEYALLRREFWPRCGMTRPAPATARRVLVTMGGADPGNATLKVIEALRLVGLRGVEGKVVVGGSNPHLEAIRQAALEAGIPNLSLVENTSDMPGLMAWADVAVSAAGTTCWELAFMRVPALLLVLAENQRPNAEELARLGAALNLGWHEDATPPSIAEALRDLLADAEARSSMAHAGAGLVDGQGAERVAVLIGQGAVRARAATLSDRDLLFAWANDPLTRQMSFRPQPIDWEEHVRWNERVLGDPGVLLMVGEAWEAGAWVPMGQVRIDGDGTVSLGLAPRLRGRRLAGPLLRTVVLAARARTPGRRLVAFIKPENAASRRVFEQVGFRLEGQVELLGQACGSFGYG